MKTTIQKISLMFLVMVMSLSVSAQEIVVKGKVSDGQDKSPLIGATVMEKNTNNSVITDESGEFSIKTRKGKILQVQYIGYKPKEVKVKGERMEIYLEPDFVVLEEEIIIGYGKPNKLRNITGAVTSLFQGRASGVHTQGMVQYDMAVPPMYPFIGRESNTEEYESLKENHFLPALKQPLSTFSLDVDVASYANIRRMINQGQMPPKDAVRVEEMINYFSYNYPQPTDGHPVNIVTETTICPWNKDHQLLRIGVKAKEIPSKALPATNFVFLIDVSGSMYSADKLPLVKSSMKLLVNNLRPQDRVAIVTYAGAAGEVLPSTSGADKQKIMDALEGLQAGGSTAGGAGIQLAYKIAEKNFVKDGNNRVILCTDGDFNVGVSTTGGLESLIESKRKSGIFLTVLGYGMGNYKDNKLQILAQKGNGNHAYIDNLQEANKVVVNEFGSTMYTVAKDVKIQVEFNPAFVNVYRLIGYESRLLNDEDFNDDLKDAGELGPGHTVTALYEIVPVGVKSPVGSIDPLKYQSSGKETTAPGYTNSKELLTVKLRYKKPDEDVSRKLEIPVLANMVNKNASDELSFIMSVAMFGQLLRDSDFKGDASYAKVLELARKGLNDDPNGYRREFIRLVEAVEQLAK
ncbi:Secreted protein containing bacterial Ig-like domain and vWFA domain [Proteiniphilum saccharofermentans]|uniref:Secreted protein containing bacterial Ig-like domain and vWFA domain n=1 Tax=Proteiniphilum saccharofermentans TaxID=1642647 RepID=A0A1R3T582_9BACT|nr:VWA domain-containing protein [Proteiniphilum saccharofermentans]SCD20438.1 Secreted protein containing bacterial Ig-like domain and vWFA domain [Proteiniphilum saccharofermentans]